MTAAPRTSPCRRVDLLRWEHDHGRLSVAALAAGQALQDLFAAAHRSGSHTWTERVDTSRTGDAGVARAVEVARRLVRTMERVERIVGPVDARLVRRVLDEGHDYASAAVLDGRSGTRAVSYTAQRFRDALEELGRATATSGPC